MAKFLQPYSARNVSVIWGPINLAGGRADEAFATITRNAPRASTRAGFSGDISVSLSTDHSYNVTLSFFPESDSAKVLNGVFQALAAAERAGQPLTGAMPLVITDPTGLNTLVCREAMMLEHSDIEYAENTGVIIFTFMVAEAVQGPLPQDVAQIVSNAVKGLGLNPSKLVPSKLR